MAYFSTNGLDEETQLEQVRQQAYEHGVEWERDVVIQKPNQDIEITFYDFKELQSVEEPAIVAIASCSVDQDTKIMHVELKRK